MEFGSVLRLQIEVSDELAQHRAFRELGRRVTQEDFPLILEIIREQMRQEFGPLADSPEVGARDAGTSSRTRE